MVGRREGTTAAVLPQVTRPSTLLGFCMGPGHSQGSLALRILWKQSKRCAQHSPLSPVCPALLEAASFLITPPTSPISQNLGFVFRVSECPRSQFPFSDLIIKSGCTSGRGSPGPQTAQAWAPLGDAPFPVADPSPLFLSIIYFLFIYLAASGLNHSMQDHLVAACKLLQHVGYSSLFRDRTQALCIGSRILATRPPGKYLLPLFHPSDKRT